MLDSTGSELERLRVLVAGLVPATEPWGRAVVDYSLCRSWCSS